MLGASQRVSTNPFKGPKAGRWARFTFGQKVRQVLQNDDCSENDRKNRICRVLADHSHRLLQFVVLSCGAVPAKKHSFRIRGQHMAGKLKDLVYAMTGFDLDFDKVSTDINAQIATASLLAVAANSDGSIDSVETEKMVGVLRKRFELTSTVALDLVTRAIDELSTGDASRRLFDELNERLTLKQKDDLLLMVLEVIAADGEKEAREMALLDQTVTALNISDRQLSNIYDRYFEARRNNKT